MALNDHLSPNTKRITMQSTQEKGVPKYMATFADLMTLILCFFILLLSMAEMDALKYKVIVNSIEHAFGVDNPNPDPIPMGTSIIKQTFSAGPPATRPHSPFSDHAEAFKGDQGKQKIEDPHAYLQAELDSIYIKLEKSLKWALDENLVMLESIDGRILIRINETASFPSGSADMMLAFKPVIAAIAQALVGLEGSFVVSGHTDNVPVRSIRYRSNWELSGARATSVVHALLEYPDLSAEQFRIEAYADTRPLASNETAQTRALNRRVEISIIN